DDGLSEKDMELENSNSYNDDNNSDYDPLELVLFAGALHTPLSENFQK
ncbi:4311_t:CDS:2, partial [Entrophospora sp. SA101]